MCQHTVSRYLGHTWKCTQSTTLALKVVEEVKRKMKFAASIVALCVTLVCGSVSSKPALAATDTYTVQPGDSLWKISLKYHVGWPDIYKANRNSIKNPALIYPGQILQIPLVSTAVTNNEQQVLVLCNQIRSKNGLPALTMNWQLERMARIKAQDMVNKHYFSHTSPTYGSPFKMMKSFGILYTYAGENIAAGQPTPQAVVNSWMKSPGHRANILSKNYTQIGVGYSAGGTYGTYWVQEFIHP